MMRRQFTGLIAGLVVSGLSRAGANVKTNHVIVAGGGIIGASIAYHLARRGAQVTLLEKLRPASGATEKSFAWINATFSKRPRSYYELNLRGIAGWRRLQQELEGELPLEWGGSVQWHPAGAEAEQLRRDVRRHQSWGYATQLVNEAELRRLLPKVAPGPAAAAGFSEQEGAVDPVEAVTVLLEKAQQFGASLRYPCEVTGLDLAGGGVRSVETTEGRILADVLVLACGIDTPRIAAMASASVPLKQSPGVLAHTAPQPRLLERVALAPGAHIKQMLNGRIVTGANFGGSPVKEASNTYGQQLLGEAARFLPPLKDAAVDRVTLGWRVLPQDEYPIVGFVERCPNLYIAAMHSGVTLAPIIGQLAAREILDGVQTDLLGPYRLSRFA